MGKDKRQSLCKVYRKQIYEQIKTNPEGLVDLIVDQHLALEALSATNKKQQLLIESLEQRILYLERKLDQDSHNSHKPPSSDNPYKKPEKKTKSTRKKSGKKPGGQKGHPGHHLKPVDEPDEIIPINPEGICHCGLKIQDGAIIDLIKRQVLDIILPTLTSTEYSGNVRQCSCGRIHHPVFPDEVTAKVQYGPAIKSLTAYLKYHGMISYDRLQQLYAEIMGINLSQATLVKFITECAKRLNPVTDEIKSALIHSDVCHFDESGFRILGSLYWLHSASTEMLTYYASHEKRGTMAMNKIGILPYFKGIAIHDHWKSYYQFMSCRHGLCNAHHLRELINFAEKGEKWAEKLINCLLDAKSEKDELLTIPPLRINYYKRRIKRILKAGLQLHPKRMKTDNSRGKQKQSPQYNLLSRLNDKIDDVIRFISETDVPFDNNQGERDIRMLKVQQKVSGGFRSRNGANSFCIIRGYISSIRKNGQSVFESIQSAWSSQVVRPKCIEIC